MDESRRLQRRAAGLLPGGVDSPVRAFRAVGGDPPFVARAEGAYLWDADGNRYVDCFGSWGPMILGHAFPPVVEAVREAVGRSASFGASHAGEANLAELVTRCFPAVERPAVCVFGDRGLHVGDTAGAGIYGAEFCDQVRRLLPRTCGCAAGKGGGGGVATLGIPGSAGVPAETAMHTLALPYNDLGAVGGWRLRCIRGRLRA